MINSDNFDIKYDDEKDSYLISLNKRFHETINAIEKAEEEGNYDLADELRVIAKDIQDSWDYYLCENWI